MRRRLLLWLDQLIWRPRLRIISEMADRGVALFGRTLVILGAAKPHSVFVHLATLERLGLVESRPETNPVPGALPRRLYELTEAGWSMARRTPAATKGGDDA